MKRPLFIFQRMSSVTKIAASRPFPMNCAINISTRSSVWPETMYLVKKMPRKHAIAAAIIAVALSDMSVPPARRYFCGAVRDVAPRIDFLLFDVRQSAHRRLVGIVGIFLVGPFFLDLGLFLIAHALGRRSMLRIGAWRLHQKRGRA